MATACHIQLWGQSGLCHTAGPTISIGATWLDIMYNKIKSFTINLHATYSITIQTLLKIGFNDLSKFSIKLSTHSVLSLSSIPSSTYPTLFPSVH